MAEDSEILTDLSRRFAERQCAAPLPEMGPKALADKVWAWEQEQIPVAGPKRRGLQRPALTISQILTWADAHREATGSWPKNNSGTVHRSQPSLTWKAIDSSLASGCRSLPGGTTLAKLLAEHRGVPKVEKPPRLTVAEILAWADAHRAATGAWPRTSSGPVRTAPHSVNWNAVNSALGVGCRGLPGGSSLANLLAEYRGIPKGRKPPRLTVAEILAWADAHRAATGAWPKSSSGAVRDAPHPVTWSAINSALALGYRGLPGGSSLVDLLAESRGVPPVRKLPRLTIDQVLAWADAHHGTHGGWPERVSGAIPGAPGESWQKIDVALLQGLRGLSPGSSLPGLLSQHRTAIAAGHSPLSDLAGAAPGHGEMNDGR